MSLLWWPARNFAIHTGASHKKGNQTHRWGGKMLRRNREALLKFTPERRIELQDSEPVESESYSVSFELPAYWLPIYHSAGFGEEGQGHETEQKDPLNWPPLELHCSNGEQFHSSPVIKLELKCYVSNMYHQVCINYRTFNRCVPDTRAADATTAFLSTTACLRYRSICPRRPASVMLHSALIAFERYKSILLFMSFISEEVTIMTCYGCSFKSRSEGQKQSSLLRQQLDIFPL
jgi:hypothetical protein